MDLKQTPSASKLLSLTRQLLIELKAERASFAVHIHANLEKELGIGSLEKAELLSRIEQSFHITLSENLLRDAKTLEDFLIAIDKAKPKSRLVTQVFAPILSAASVNPNKANTLIDVLREYAEKEPNRPHIYFHNEDDEEITLTYGELLENANLVASGLQQLGLHPGDTVAIMLPTCLDFFFAFCGILIAGCIPVPIYPPFRPDQIESYIQRESGILGNAEVRVLITFKDAAHIGKLLKTYIPSLKAITTVSTLQRTASKLKRCRIKTSDPGLIQYTSGSTGDPKGVLLSHHNLLSNIRAYGQAVAIKPSDVCVSWLPLYHDMGLIGAWMGSFYHGIPLTLLTPLSFLTHPEKWLWTLHYHRGTLAASPNFGYELCIRKINSQKLEGLDLSAWRIAANGAEAINPGTLTRFYKKFSSYGLKNTTLFPVYGLAECTVGLALPPIDQTFKIDHIDRDLFEKEQRAVAVATETKHKFQFVSCGSPIPDHEIRIVDDSNQALPDRHVGQLQFRGPSAMQGYFRNACATKAIYHDGWYDTGDYAYIAEGELYITGRKKDVIIKAGRSFHPDDIEIAVAQVNGVRKGCVVAFGVQDREKMTEQFVIVAETREKKSTIKKQMSAEIIEKALATVGVPPDAVILVAPKTIPKTSSGKLQRASCKALYNKNKLSRAHPAVWYQVSKLFCKILAKKTYHAITLFLRFFYTLYCGTILGLHTPIIIFTVSLTRSKAAARNLCRFWAQWVFTCCGTPVTVHGKKHLLPSKPIIYVANHSSYIDFLVLLIALPANTVFVGKKELWHAPLLGWFMKKLSYMVVDRYDFLKSQTDVAHIQQRIITGDSIAIFPEGTFFYATGLRAFKSGAFKVAVDTKTPVCPVTISGTRQFLRAGTWLLKLTRLRVNISAQINPTGHGWASVSTLQQKTRAAILKHSDEQALS